MQQSDILKHGNTFFCLDSSWLSTYVKNREKISLCSSNTGSCSVKRVDYSKLFRLKREQLVHLLNRFVLVYINYKI